MLDARKNTIEAPDLTGDCCEFYFATMLGKLEVWKLSRYFPPAPTYIAPSFFSERSALVKSALGIPSSAATSFLPSLTRPTATAFSILASGGESSYGTASGISPKGAATVLSGSAFGSGVWLSGSNCFKRYFLPPWNANMLKNPLLRSAFKDFQRNRRFLYQRESMTFLSVKKSTVSACGCKTPKKESFIPPNG